MEAAPWFIHKLPDGHCEIDQSEQSDALKTWGPYPDQAEALARRVGLIRSGQCQPKLPVQKES